LDKYDNDDDFIDADPTPILTPSPISSEAKLNVILFDVVY